MKAEVLIPGLPEPLLIKELGDVRISLAKHDYVDVVAMCDFHTDVELLGIYLCHIYIQRPDQSALLSLSTPTTPSPPLDENLTTAI